MSKFFRSASDSSSSSNSSVSSFDSKDNNTTTNIVGNKKMEDEYRYETPPKQIGIINVNDPDGAWETMKSTQVFANVPTKHLPYSSSSFKEERWLRCACISDTHGRHDDIILPACDVLFHGGDLTMTGLPHSLERIIHHWFPSQLKKVRNQIIFIAGNHDLTLHKEHYPTVWPQFHTQKADISQTQQLIQNLPSNQITYLQDESYQLHHQGEEDDCSLTVYGSPWQPLFHDWAFNMERDCIGDKIWSQIPSNTDILLTHGPPLGRGDLLTNRKNRVGCVDLLRHVQTRIQPKLHIFGHIHESHGVSFDGTTLYVNASSVHGAFIYNIRNPVTVIDIPLHDSSLPAHYVQPPSQHPTLSTNTDLLQWLQQQQQYEDIIPYFQQQPSITVNDLMITDHSKNKEENEAKFQLLCQRLGLCRKPKLRETLYRIRMHLLAESYGTTW